MKIPATVLLILFCTMQYGKLISYWNCKVTNSSDPVAVQCDCEKILTDTNGDDDSNVMARVQKADKAWDFYHVNIPVKISDFNFSFISAIRKALISLIPGDFHLSVFQPPRL